MNLKAWRQKEGMTQREAAKRLSIIIGRPLLPAVLSRWERRDRAPRKADAAKIVDALRGIVRLEDLTKVEKTEGEAYWGLGPGALVPIRKKRRAHNHPFDWPSKRRSK